MSYEAALTVWRDVLPQAEKLLPRHMASSLSDVMLLAIGLQESGLTERVQRGGGPAHGLWQFERGGGVLGVLTHPASRQFAVSICVNRGVRANARDIWNALPNDDVLAAVFARLLLWTDPLPLPKADDDAAAWSCYARIWRPGKPHPERWQANHETARKVVGV